MSKIGRAIHEIQSLDALAKEDRWVNHIHPLVKLCLTVLYITLTVSISKYDLSRLFGMVVYPVFVFVVGELSFADALRRLRIVLPAVCIIGVLNPFFDRGTLMVLGGVSVPAGVISMITLMQKAVLTVLAAYLLIASTTIERLCYAMRLLHIPQFFVIEVMLIYRYISVLLAETRRVMDAYALRAPGQKGVAIGAWGPLAGQLLLRSMDRAERLYQSMKVRGFRGEFYYGGDGAGARDYAYFAVWAAVMLLMRMVPVAEIVGGLFV